ncbi:MAG: dihydroxy-acid dehydratase [Chthoniobacter sp.]
MREGRIQAGDVMVLAGIGPLGTGMEETYQITSALKTLPFGKHVALLTDARFSGVSTGACVGHIGPEALAGENFRWPKWEADWQKQWRDVFTFAELAPDAFTKGRF